jgi:radical SAM-linked protein
VVLGHPEETPEDRAEWEAAIANQVDPRASSRSTRLVVEVLSYPEVPAASEPPAGVLEAAERWRRRWRKSKVRVEVVPWPFHGSKAVEDTLPWAPPARGRAREEAPEGFGIPAWHEGRRPRRAARVRELQRAERYRLRFSKDERLRFISHLDVTRAYTRAFRRSQLPLALSNGKERRPKVSFGPPLPLGMTSGAEFVDVAFAAEVPESFVRSLNEALPEGLAVVGYAPIRTEPASLMSAIEIAEYEVSFPDVLMHDGLGANGFDGLLERLDTRVRQALAADRWIVMKTRGEETKPFNVRPSLHRASVVRDDGGRPALSLTLSLNRPDSVRPERLTATLIDWMSVDERLLRVHRSSLAIPGRNKDLDPLDVVASGFEWWRQPVRGGTVL